MKTIWPNRRWVRSAEGWVGREANFADDIRRQHVENSLSRDISEDQREWENMQIEHWESVNERFDRHTATISRATALI